MYQLRVLIVLGVAALSAWGGNKPEHETKAPGEAASHVTTVEDAPARGSVGPIEYSFAPQILTRTEIQIKVPPGFDHLAWATKLIPLGRASTLGEMSCRYGASGQVQLCSADREDGLAMALLERPIGDYRRQFANDSAQGSKLEPSTLAGHSGFKYSLATAASGVIYGFYPVGERTLLLARRFSAAGAAVDPAIGQVLMSLRFPARNDD